MSVCTSVHLTPSIVHTLKYKSYGLLVIIVTGDVAESFNLSLQHLIDGIFGGHTKLLLYSCSQR